MEQFQRQLQKCQEILAKGQKSNWGCEWFRVFEPIFDEFVTYLYGYIVDNSPTAGKRVELCSTFLLQATLKIMPYMPKFDGLPEYHLLSTLNNLSWLHDTDELAEIARIVKGEAGAGAVKPLQRKEPSSNTYNSTVRLTNKLKRPATDLDDSIEESPTKKVARHVRQLPFTRASGSSKKTCAPGTSLTSEHVDQSVLDALNDIRDSFVEGIKRLDKLETILRS